MGERGQRPKTFVCRRQRCSTLTLALLTATATANAMNARHPPAARRAHEPGFSVVAGGASTI